MRSPDLPEILIAAGLVACIAFAVYNWLHRRKGNVGEAGRTAIAKCTNPPRGVRSPRPASRTLTLT